MVQTNETLMPDVKLARLGDEAALGRVMTATWPLAYKLYLDRLTRLMEREEWRSECWLVLHKVIKRYSENHSSSSQFTTYYVRALYNQMNSLWRHYYSKQVTFEREMMSLNMESDQQVPVENKIARKPLDPDALITLGTSLGEACQSVSADRVKSGLVYVLGGKPDQNKKRDQKQYRVSLAAIKTLKQQLQNDGYAIED